MANQPIRHASATAANYNIRCCLLHCLPSGPAWLLFHQLFRGRRNMPRRHFWRRLQQAQQLHGMRGWQQLVVDATV
jgi:hypothetical protein